MDHQLRPQSCSFALSGTLAILRPLQILSPFCAPLRLGQIRTNHVFSLSRIELRVIRVLSSLLSIFWKVDSQKHGYFEARIDSHESAH